jgi:hypothetical protein
MELEVRFASATISPTREGHSHRVRSILLKRGGLKSRNDIPRYKPGWLEMSDSRELCEHTGRSEIVRRRSKGSELRVAMGNGVRSAKGDEEGRIKRRFHAFTCGRDNVGKLTHSVAFDCACTVPGRTMNDQQDNGLNILSREMC